MFCARCGKDLREKNGEESQACDQCGWSAGQTEQWQTSDGQQGNGKGIASLVLGIFSLLTFGGFLFLPFIGFSLGISGLKSEQPGIAMVGIVLNGMVLALCILLLMLLAVLLAMSSSGSPVFIAPVSRCC